jgi:anti-anti-sigma regulatory factor
MDGQGQVRMLKISVVEGPRRRRVILEGTLVAPWAAELTTACEAARANLHGRQLIVDLRSLTAISPEGESVLMQLMNEKIKFHCGVFMKEVLRQLARKRQRMSQHAANENSDG